MVEKEKGGKGEGWKRGRVEKGKGGKGEGWKRGRVEKEKGGEKFQKNNKRLMD